MSGDTGGCHLPKGELECREVLESEDCRESHPNAHFHLRAEAFTHFQWACLDTEDQDTASLNSGAFGCRQSGHLPLSGMRSLHKLNPLGLPVPKLNNHTG